ncbi:P-loop NTPase fold protein [Actinoplanes sp. NPDC051470]|uniref:KAP family P-loop NTPase fold protein n=1 Tax=Actinoplanes sp. NPDC051470 TaxID=3157224 RepID=UPI003449FE7D
MSRVEIVVGDLFDSDAPFLVVPCGVDGTMVPEVRRRVQRLGGRPPAAGDAPGVVVAAPAPDGRILLFAMTADPEGAHGGSRLVERAASRIGTHANAADAVVAAPLLGTRAGGLEPLVSLNALVSGFGTTANPQALLRVHVLTEEAAEPLRRGLAEARLESRFADDVLTLGDRPEPLSSGAFVAALGYPAPDAGPVRSGNDHLQVVHGRWSVAWPLDAAHVAAGLALDSADLGWALLRSGALVDMSHGWDHLTDNGRRLAEDQPLLATALGAPAEWSAELPGTISAVAFSPQVDRFAALVGEVVYDVNAAGRIRRVGAVAGRVVSLGWRRGGIIALRLEGDDAEVVWAESGAVLCRAAGMRSGRLSGGMPAWLIGPGGAARYWGDDRPPEWLVPEAREVIATEASGRRALIGIGDRAVLVSTLTEDTAEAGTMPATSAVFPAHTGPCVLVSLGRDTGVATSGSSHVAIAEPGGPTVAIISAGAEVGLLAASQDGHCLAVASGATVSVWPVGRTRPVSQSIAGYEPDDRDSNDLLDAERDALALSALIASEKLRPPLAIGLFGEWGSGKTFVLERILRTLRQFTGVEGYLDEVSVVEFNAWHYAETNLWASLVDQVLRRITERQDVVDALPDVVQVDREADAAARTEQSRKKELATAREVERAAKSWRVRQRLTLVAAGLLVAAAGAVTLAGVWPVVVAALAVVAGVAAQVKAARQHATEVSEAGRTAAGVLGFRAAERAARDAEQRREQAEIDVRRAAEETGRRKAEQAGLRKQAETEPLAMILRQVSEVTEYREELSLVTRTRELFHQLDRGFVAGRRRVVLAIDDLDRCPAEKVVQVLEAVHLLFNFEMFVVVLAVDTRWLEQSLRIRYHQLLGDSGSATPSDYLEKIIQIPVRLTPLDESLVRQMITGLTGQQPPRESVPAAPEPASTPLTPAPPVPAKAQRPPRMPRKRFPARLLETTGDEAAALSAVAPLLGRTPRTVKRFVNTYQILKARTNDPAEFHHPRGGVGDHEVVAFLLAVVTGQPAAATLIGALATDRPDATLGALLSDVDDPALEPIRGWLERNSRYADAPSHRYAEWAPEVARFSFVDLRS